MRPALLLAVTLAGCAASGSDDQTHGPVFGDDAGSDASGDATTGDATTSDAASSDDATSGGDDATGDDAAGDDGGAIDAPVADVGSDAPACTSTTALLAGSTSAAYGASAAGEASLAAQSVSGSFASAPGVGVLSGAFEAVARENGNALASSALGVSWSGFAALTGNPASLDAPAIAQVGSALHAVYLGTDNRYYHATFDGTSWDSGSDRVGVVNDAGAQAFGPARASAAAVGSEFVIAYQGNDNLVHAQSWTSANGWTSGVQVGSDTVATNEPVALVALSGGAHDLLVVYEKASDTKLYAATRAAGAKQWGAPSVVNANAFTHDAPSLAGMSGARAMLAWRGTDGFAYTSAYDDGAGTWSAPAPLVSPTNPAVPSAPSLAAGVCGDDAVAAYVSAGAVGVARYRSGAWLAPSSVANVSAASVVTIATAP